MFTTIILWLKSSVIGLVILGAIGSMFAAFLLKALSYLFRPLFEKTISVHIKYMAMQNWLLGGLSAENNGSKIAVYLLYHLMTFLVPTALFSTSLVALIFRLTLQSAEIFNALNFSLITLAFLCLYSIMFKLWTIRITYQVHVLPLLGGRYQMKQSDTKRNKTKTGKTQLENGRVD